MKNILETLTDEGRFKALLKVVEMSGLADKLAGAGPFTLFAPDDTAFERVNFQEITKDKNDLDKLAQYHVVAGTMTAAEIAGADKIYTECGKSLTVHKEEGQPVIDNGRLVRTDIVCSNGIIHVMNNVFLPQFSGWYCGGCC